MCFLIVDVPYYVIIGDKPTNLVKLNDIIKNYYQNKNEEKSSEGKYHPMTHHMIPNNSLWCRTSELSNGDKTCDLTPEEITVLLYTILLILCSIPLNKFKLCDGFILIKNIIHIIVK